MTPMCPADDGLASDISAVAGGYTTVAAVLAGFAFSGLILLLTVRLLPETSHHLPKSYPASLRALLAAFVSLALTAVNYAYLGGLGDWPGPAASHAIPYGQGFAIGALQLIYAVLLVLATAEGSKPSRFNTDGVFGGFQKVTVYFVAPFIALALLAGMAEYQQLHFGGEPYLTIVGWLPVAAVLAVAFWWFVRRDWKRPAPGFHTKAPTGSATGVVAALTLVTFFPFFNPSNPCETAPSGVILGCIVVSGVAVVGLTLALARFRAS